MLKNNKYTFITYICIYCIAIIIGLHFRLYPLRQHLPENVSEKATLFVITQLKNKITYQINITKPELSSEEKEILIQKQLNALLHKETPEFQKTIQRVAKKMEENQPQTPSKPYLLASDSFYYYNLTENIIKTGKISDKIIGSKYLNKLMLAPVGHLEPFNLHPYVGYFIYKILKIFNPNISLMYAVSFTPLILTCLALIPFLFICALSNIHPVLSLTSSIFFLLSPIFIKRSTFGWYDNDPYNILFPLIILSLFFKNRDSNYFYPKKITLKNSRCPYFCYAGLTALSFILYAFFWQGWVLVFTVLILSSIAILLNNHFFTQNKTNTKSIILYFSIIFGGSFLGVSLSFGPQEFFTLFAEGWHALKNFLSPQLSLWPDLYISVGELHNSSLSQIITLTGGIIFFIIALIGIIYSFLYQRKTSITLTIFLAVSIIITLGAQRFAMLCLIPLSLLFAFGLQGLYEAIHYFLSKNKFFKYISPIFLILILSLSLLPIRNIHKTIASLLNPLFNQTWEKTLVNIDKNTPQNSIINAWWPPGHFIKAIAHRRVTFDGASINYPQAYWLSNFFLSQTEEEAVGILRMLNNSANQASEYLHNDLGLPLSTSVSLLKKIAPLNTASARIFLNQILPSSKNTEHLLKLTHTTPPPSYVLIYKEFVESNLQLKFIGGWDFKTIEDINNDPKRIASVPNRKSKNYIDFLWTLAGGPYKYSSPLSQIKRKKNILLFKNNITVNLNTITCTINSPKYGQGIPQSIFYLKNNEIIEKKFSNASLTYSIILYKKNNTYKVILADQPLANSILLKLYFFKGKGMKHFKLFSDESDLTQRNEILVFEVK